MTDAEQQLRAILREHAAAAEHLLEEVLVQAYVVPSGALDVAALRAAAKPMPIAAVEPTQQASGGWIEPWEFLPEPAPVPPTLTLEEVFDVLRLEIFDVGLLGNLKQRFQERLAQKGAGRD